MRNLLPWVGKSDDDSGTWTSATTRFRKTGPRRVRIAATVALARWPMPYRIWKHLWIFEHGDMNQFRPDA
jgi:hypothetical protein